MSLSGMSTIGRFGSTSRIAAWNDAHSYSPWKSSTTRNPPRSRYSRSRSMLLALRKPIAAARLLQEQPRIVEQRVVLERRLLAVGGNLDPRHALDGGQEVRFGERPVDRPPRIAPAARSRAADRGVGEPRHVELGLRQAAVLGCGGLARELRARGAAEHARERGQRARRFHATRPAGIALNLPAW